MNSSTLSELKKELQDLSMELMYVCKLAEELVVEIKIFEKRQTDDKDLYPDTQVPTPN